MTRSAKNSSRMLKLDSRFTPPQQDGGDEFFRNGIFEFNVTKLLAFIAANSEKLPIEQVDLETLPDYGGGGALDQVSINAANLANPIILAELSPGRFNIIDGNHRVERARRDGVEQLPAYRISAELHVAFLTSLMAYEKYVDYWNSKIRDQQ